MSLNMDPRLATALVRHACGERTLATATSAVDEISVLGVVSDLDAWCARPQVRPGTAIADGEGRWIVTAWLALADVIAVRSFPEVVTLKAARPLSRMLGTTVPDILGAPASLPPGLQGGGGGAGVVVGVIDQGADFAHRNFLRPDGTTRLLALWDQASDVRYATEQINAALGGGGDPYVALGYGPRVDRPDEQGMHGTHVMDIAAGNGRGSGVAGVAPAADLVFVDVDASDIQFQGPGAVKTSFGDSSQLVRALEFIFGVAGDRPCVINVSMGLNGGPHDGKSPLEQAIDRFVAERPNRAVVVAASNTFSDHIHAAGTVAAGESRDVTFVRPLRAGEIEFELWYSGADEFAAEILVDGRSLGTVALGKDRLSQAADGRPLVYIAHRADDPNNHDNTVGVFIGEAALGRVWTVRLHGVRVSHGGFHAWIERNDYAQASFVSPHDDSHTVASIGCGRRAIVVGSYDAHAADLARSPFSAAGPTRDGRSKPDVSAPGQKVLAAWSRTQTKVTEKSGTSMAAPAVTGLVAVLLGEARARGRDLSAEETLALVVAAARRDPPAGGGWDDRYGFGRVSVRGALEGLEP